jgi:hypothetical protein
LIINPFYIQDSDASFNGESENNDNKDDDLYNRYEDDIPWEFPLVIAEPDVQVRLYSYKYTYMYVLICVY